MIKIGIFLHLCFACFYSYQVRAEIHQEFLTDQKQVEYIWDRPIGGGPWPIIFFLHPHQEWPHKIGAKFFVDFKIIDKWVQRGFVAVAISQPGYGGSDGPADFCGPETQKSVISVIDLFKNRPFVRQDQIFIYGGSRGAVVASMLATQNRNFAGGILKSGVYDLEKAYKQFSWLDGVKWNILWEIGIPDIQKFKERSSIFFADKISSPLLIIHGNKDDRSTSNDAKEFSDAVNRYGGHSELIVFNSGHVIPMSEVDTMIEKFVNLQLGKFNVGAK